MNILFYAYDFTPHAGGVQRVTNIISAELKNRGHNICLLCGCPIHNSEYTELGFPAFYLDESLSEPFGQNSISRYRAILEKYKIDIVINQYPLNPKGDVLFENTPDGIKKIAFYHGMPFGMIDAKHILNKKEKNPVRKTAMTVLIAKERLWTKKRFRRIIELSDKVCLLTPKNIEILETVLNFRTEKLCSIPNPNTFPESEYEPTNKKNVILFVGRISDSVKNLSDFIEVWKIASSSLPDWQAVIVGNDSGCEKHKQDIIRRHIPRITFAGQQSAIMDFYKEAKISCVTSHSEGWPMVISESMTYGCIPCAFSTFNSVFELIEDDESGVICAPYDVNGMARKIIELANNPQKMGKMSANAINHIRKFSVKEIASQYERLFSELCK